MAGRDDSFEPVVDAGCWVLVGDGFVWAPAIDADSNVILEAAQMERREAFITLRCSRKGDTTVGYRVEPPATLAGVHA